MKIVNVHEAKTNLSRLLAELEKTGAPVVICRNGRPVANLVSCKKQSRLKTDPELSRIDIRHDPTEPLSESEWPRESR